MIHQVSVLCCADSSSNPKSGCCIRNFKNRNFNQILNLLFLSIPHHRLRNIGQTERNGSEFLEGGHQRSVLFGRKVDADGHSGGGIVTGQADIVFDADRQSVQRSFDSRLVQFKGPVLQNKLTKVNWIFHPLMNRCMNFN